MTTHAYRRSALLLVAALVVFIVGSLDVGRHVRAAPLGTTVSRWQTSQAGDRLTAKANLSFAADDTSNLPAIQITPTRYYQAIDGFGGTLTRLRHK